LEAPPLNVPATLTQSILNLVSIQFVSLSLPHPHTWALSNETDPAIVVNPQVTFGFPRGF
jgi:hypothetical protein